MQNFSAEELHRSTVYDNDGDKVGKVEQVYLDDESDRPSWITVNTGLFGTNESFVPVDQARQEGDRLTVPFDKKQIKDSPNFDPKHHLDARDEQTLYGYYGMGHQGTGHQGTGHEGTGTAAAAGAAGTAAAGQEHRHTDRDELRHGVEHGEHDTSRGQEEHRDHGDSDSIVRSEEELRVGKETQTAGKARLRKHVVSETEQVDVPVQREELRIERESLSDSEASNGGKIGGDHDETVTLREERPVVDKEVVGKEKVRVGKETVTDTERVSEDVRKEDVNLDTEGKTGHERGEHGKR